jgi:hypothetical protein
LLIFSFALCVFTVSLWTPAQAYYSSYGVSGLSSSYGSAGLYGSLYGGGLYGGMYGGLYGSSLGSYGGLYGSMYGGLYGGMYGGLYGSSLGLYGGGYGLGMYGGGLSSLYGGLYGGLYGSMYGGLYGGSMYGGLYGSSLGLYGGGYGLGLYGGGLSSLYGGLYGGLGRYGLAEQTGLWTGTYSNGLTFGSMTLNLVEDPVVVGALSGYVQLLGNAVLPTLVSITGQNVNGQITLTGSNGLAGGKLVAIDIAATLISPTEIDGDYSLTLTNLGTVPETGSFKVTLTTPVI